MVKLQTNPVVYTVGQGGLLHAVPSEAVAVGLYGTNWNTKIDDINDAFWNNYHVGTPLVTASDFSPAASTAAATSISVDKSL